ncbi:uncharacterized protein A4U43_C06F8420 [Asparagus officinalis]|uniref:Uncharacterized protein n=1 Tax=Asparagus officinalis TaxID=4686 RepID=A0A5P1EKE1_ASPOF|nr:uncharacterized protein A4U43_C06F8420 [Asparagus officinalis]
MEVEGEKEGERRWILSLSLSPSLPLPLSFLKVFWKLYGREEMEMVTVKDLKFCLSPALTFLPRSMVILSVVSLLPRVGGSSSGGGGRRPILAGQRLKMKVNKQV